MLENPVYSLSGQWFAARHIFYLGGVFEVWFLGESFHKVGDFGGPTIMIHHVSRRTRRSNYLLAEISAMENGDKSGSDFINKVLMIFGSYVGWVWQMHFTHELDSNDILQIVWPVIYVSSTESSSLLSTGGLTHFIGF